MRATTAARLAVAALAAAAAPLAAPGAARAVTTCELSSGVLDVTVAASGDDATLAVDPGGSEIQVSDEAGALACVGTTPTVFNTNAISAHNSPGLQDNRVAILAAGRFAPGLNAVGENGGTPEIEIFVNLNDAAGSSILAIHSTPGLDLILGANGANPNFSELETGHDADIVASNVLQIAGVGGAGAELITAAGGAGTGAPMAETVFLEGNGGDDTLVGGEGSDGIEGGEGDDDVSARGGADFVLGGAGADELLGDAGADTLDGGGSDGGEAVDSLLGGPGDDVLRPGPAADQAFGGDGTDELDLSLLGSGVAVTLDDAQEIEVLTGTPFADVLRGDDGPDVIAGLGGNDVLEGRGGADTLRGGDGDDTLEARDGGADSGDCGSGADAVVADLPGIDLLSGCETVLFPDAGPPGGGAGGGPPGGGAPGGRTGATDATAPRLTGYRLSRSALRPPRGRRRRASTRVRYTLSEPAVVRFAVERAARGRRRGGGCRRPTARNRRGPRCTRYRTLRGTFAHTGRRGANSVRFAGRLRGRALRPGRYRLVAVATDAAGNRSAPRRVRFAIVRRRERG